ncbi:MAG: Electron transport complex subunit RsxE [Eubacteriales bacterium]|jgi:Na+-translocating ferredoxin:NAD+ oxidoreductase RnfE subunit
MRNRRILLRETGTIFLNGVLYKNPVLVGALGMFPVVFAGNNLKNAAVLSLLYFFLSVPLSLFFCLVGEMVPAWMRPGLVLASSALFYLPAAWLTDKIEPGSIASLGMAASLMICNSMMLSRATEYAPTHIGWAVAADALGCSAGFMLVITLTVLVRSLWQTYADTQGAISVSMPFFGFLILGFFAAFVQWMNEKRSKKSVKKR